MSLHQSVAGRCDPAVEHTPVRMYKGKDCVYCKVTCGVKKRTTCQYSKLKLHYAFLLETVFINFIKKVSWKTGGRSLPVNPFLSLLADLKEAQCKKDTEREKNW